MLEILLYLSFQERSHVEIADGWFLTFFDPTADIVRPPCLCESSERELLEDSPDCASLLRRLRP